MSWPFAARAQQSAMPVIGFLNCRSGRPHPGCQAAGLVAVRETGLTCANMLRAFQFGNALTRDGGPSSWMRPSPVAWAQVSWPACHLTKASGLRLPP